MPGPETELEWLLSQFHAEWDETFETWEDLVDDWAAGSAPRRRAAAAAQIGELLPSANDSQQFAIQLSRMGCDFDPRPEHGGYRAWLTAVRDRLLQREPDQRGQ